MPPIPYNRGRHVRAGPHSAGHTAFREGSMRSLRLHLAVFLGLLLLAACGGGGKSTTPPPGGGGGTRSLSGTVTYDFVPATITAGLDFAHAVQKPVRNAVVQVVRGTTVLATSSTNATGNYSLTFTDAGTGQLAVVALAKTAAMPVIQVQDNTDGNAIWAIGANLDATQTTQNLRATHGWTGTAFDVNTRTAAPFAILDSMYTAATAFIAVRPAATFPALPVNWSPNNVPQSGNKAQGFITTSHFSGSENAPVGMIYILGKDGVDTDEFDSHVMVHEWGHYFEHNLSRSDSPGGQHSGGEEVDPRLAFGEGYGNAIAAMLLPESMYVDTSWNTSTHAMRAFGFDAEAEPNPTDDPLPGVFSEVSVMRFLYDLFDGANEAHDGVALGLGPIYDVLVGPQKTNPALTTVASFITGLKAQAGVNAAAVNTLAAHYNIGLNGGISDVYGTGDANFEWFYYPLASLPADSCGAGCRTGNFLLTGQRRINEAYANQYVRFTAAAAGTVTVRATSTEDVAIQVFLAGPTGSRIAVADNGTTGTETATFNAATGSVYFIDVVGFSNVTGDYQASIEVQGGL